MRSTRSSPPSPGMVRRFAALFPKHVVPVALAVVAAGLLVSLPAHASLTLTTSADRDTFVIFGSSETGLGGRGAMQIAAPTTSQPYLEETVFSFNTASLKALLDYNYGAGKWVVSSASVTLYSNNPTAGTQPENPRFNVIEPGLFQLRWLSNDSWDEGTLTSSNLSDYLPGTGTNTQQTLGTYYYRADGTSPLTWVLSESSGLV